MTALRSGFVTGAPSSSNGKRCIKITTDTNQDHDGRVTVYIDQGTGFQAATPINEYYAKGSTVLDECYANLTAVRMQNTDNDGWDGAVMFARDKAGPYSAGVCPTCDTVGSSADIAFDCDDTGGAPTKCLNGKMCDITFDLEEPTPGGWTRPL